MAASKRTLAAFAAGALLVPLSPLAALADHIEQRTRDNACPPNEVSEGNYTDVEDGALFEREINCVSDYGIATGTGGGEYSPEDNVSRRQMAQFIYREALLGDVEFDTTTDPGYSDDNELTGEARDAVWGLTNAGVLKGVGGGRFAPNENVTRAQMATFLVGLAELLGLEGFETTTDYFDDDDNTTHETNINKIAEEGVTIGQGGDRVYGFLNPVLRQQMAAFLARILDIAVEQGVIESVYETTPANVTVDQEGEEISAGDEITGTVTGSNIAGVDAVGDCLVDGQEITDEDAATEDIEFTLETDPEATAGNCEITFTVTFENGRTQDFTTTVTIADVGEGTNERPELVEAEIVQTTTAGQVTPTRDAGVVVSYTFDEDILDEAGVDLDAELFQIYTADGTVFDGDEIVSIEGNVVTVQFDAEDGLATADDFATITLATVDQDAVRDTEGDTNPEGDAELGTTSGGGGTVTLPAGQTDGPDLVSVSGFRQGANPGETAVDFTFDEAAFVSNEAGFALILIEGAAGADNDNQADCVGPEAGGPVANATEDGEPSGGTVAGGNGTTTITVICNVGDADAELITAADVARGTVDSGTVSDVQQDEDTTNIPTGNSNPLQSADVSAGGNTAEPDLVSVTLVADDEDPDTDPAAIFTFDQNVEVADGAQDFYLYDADGNETQGTTAEENPNNARQVLVEFGDANAGPMEGGLTEAELDEAVGGNVRDGAVQTPGGTPTNLVADRNEQDEVGFENTSGGTEGQTAGRTAGPDLLSVELAEGEADVFGNTEFEATYTFDEDVNDEANASDFYLYLADGTQLQATACEAGNTDDGNEDTVTCTAYTITESDTAADEGDAASSEQIADAVLGTVDDGAVTDADGDSNPEGAEPTTGGTGTVSA